MSEQEQEAHKPRPATYEETFFTLCGALNWAFTPDPSFETVAIAAEATANELMWQKSQRMRELQALRRVIAERDALLTQLKAAHDTLDALCMAGHMHLVSAALPEGFGMDTIREAVFSAEGGK